MSYDSRPDTYDHIRQVQIRMHRAIVWLMKSSMEHDQTKLEGIELETFDEFTPRLWGMTYGSDEYKKCIEDMAPALRHHYEHNSHHPEYYAAGIRGMSLMDLIEMVCDWSAATMRHANGEILQSIEINQKRFGYSDELKQILINTAHDLWMTASDASAHQCARRAKCGEEHSDE